MFGWNWIPQGWYACNGQTYPIQGNQALFAVVGFTYGGDNRTVFAVPNIQCCAPLGMGSGPGLTPRQLGPQPVGAATVTITSSTLAAHSHSLNFVGSARGGGPLVQTPTTATMPVQEITPIIPFASTPTASSYMSPLTLSPTPAVQTVAHSNMQPMLAMTFAINWDGTYPSPAD